MERVILPDTSSFDVTINEAKKIQEHLRSQIVLADTVDLHGIQLVGGVDCAFLKQVVAKKQQDKSSYLSDITTSYKNMMIEGIAAAVVVDINTGEIKETVYARAPVYFPYIPGFLSFREGPAVLAAIRELNRLPGVMMYDGCGIAHPRGCGLASHMSVITGIPSIGCAKSKLCGQCSEPAYEKGSSTDIVYNEHVVGSCLRTRNGIKPVYVSPGSGISISGARHIVLKSTAKYRLPEPTRLAHNAVTRYKRELMGAMY